ncbi:MAG TPA: hypothetical protein VJ476_07490 [Rhizomicrobium sp.]|nr:hypothetical protein [Rhizomicrobium sp.]
MFGTEEFETTDVSVVARWLVDGFAGAALAIANALVETNSESGNSKRAARWSQVAIAIGTMVSANAHH